MKKILCFILLAALLAQSGCGGTKASRYDPSRTPAKFDFGRSTTPESLYRVVIDVLGRYGYRNTRAGNTTIIESDWHAGLPDQDEAALNIVETRHRLDVIMVNRRNTSEATLHLSCEGHIENGPWMKIPPSPSVIKVMEDMQREVRQALSQIMTQW